jgi:SAM-dependent methyltransferase
LKAFSLNNQWRLYRDLAWLWPIISPPEDYVGETERLAKVIRKHARIEVKTLLNLGCGGGHHDYTLKKHFKVTGIDVSEDMLELAKRLNPEVTYHLDDMKTARLSKTFDAVTIFDSINYMLTREELSAAFTTAFEHLKAGGILLTIAEETAERFQQNKTLCSTHVQGDNEIAFIQNYYDPDPADTTYEANFIYLIRHSGKLELQTDYHLGGIFRLETWLDALRKSGFEVKQTLFQSPPVGAEDYPVLLGVRP